MRSAPQAERAETHSGRAEELLDVLFATAKELRHLTEVILGQDFVPTEVVDEDEHSADLLLRAGGIGEIHVFATRERHRHPYRVTRIEHVAR